MAKIAFGHEVTSLGSAIFAFLAAGTFRSVEEGQDALCPKFRTVEPRPDEAATSEKLFGLYRKLYFAMGKPGSEAAAIGDVLPRIAAEVRAGRSEAAAR